MSDDGSPADKPVGIFDSGLGGLTVVREMRRQLPFEHVIYYGDTARVPYGNKSPETVVRYARQIGDFLLERDVKAIVVACNTATAYALGELRKRYADKVVIIGVIDPGVKAALDATRNGSIGVIGTRGTIASGVYERALMADQKNVRVTALATPLLVPLVEEDWLDHEASKLIVREYVKPLKAAQIDTLVLGCTHYPLLKAVLAEEFGPEVKLVDSAENTAAALVEALKQAAIVRESKAAGSLKIYVSDIPRVFGEMAARFLGASVGSVERVTLD
jgi:glutamate racemase